MNHNTQYNRLLQSQKLYTAFLTTCPPDKVTALTHELHKIDLRIKKINGMSIEQAITPVPFYFETKNSKINFSHR